MISVVFQFHLFVIINVMAVMSSVNTQASPRGRGGHVLIEAIKPRNCDRISADLLGVQSFLSATS